MRKKINSEDIDEVLMALACIDNIKDMRYFTYDLFTEKELHLISMRWKAVRMLKGGFSYSQITSVTGLSSATIARLARRLHDRVNGFDIVLNELL